MNSISVGGMLIMAWQLAHTITKLWLAFAERDLGNICSRTMLEDGHETPHTEQIEVLSDNFRLHGFEEFDAPVPPLMAPAAQIVADCEAGAERLKLAARSDDVAPRQVAVIHADAGRLVAAFEAIITRAVSQQRSAPIVAL